MLRIPSAPPKRILTRLSVLLVSSDHNDHISLGRILNDQRPRTVAQSKWFVSRIETAEPAIAELQRRPIPIVVCEDDSAPGAWRKLVDMASQFTDPPLIIVTSRLADDRLWAEALNLGAWDVLAKPWNPEEVSRTLHLAWDHWSNRPVFGARSRRDGAPASMEARLQYDSTDQTEVEIE